MREGSGGGPGWFQNSGEFGIQMASSSPCLFAFFFALKEHWTPWKKKLFLFFPLIALTGTISSSSRGAILGAVSVLFFVLFIKGKNKIKSVFVLAIILAFVYFLIPDQSLTRFYSAGEDNTSISRLVYWKRGLELVSRFPFLGVGYNNWIVAQEKIFGLYGELVSHNIFIQCASELGYIGLFVFILMILFTFVNNFQTRKFVSQPGNENRFIYYMAHGLDGALVGYLVSGFFVTVLYYPYFWINLAMTVSLNAIARNKADKSVNVLGIVS